MSVAGDMQIPNPNNLMTSLLSKDVPAHRLQATNFSPAGNAMINQVTYPPGDDSGFQGLTTAEKRNCTQLKFRTLDFNPFPASVDLTGTNVVPDPACQNIGYLLPNGMRNFAIGFKQSAIDGKWDLNYTDVVQNPNIDPGDSSGISKFNQTHKSGTFYGNMTAFNDLGAATVTQFRPSMIFAGTFSRVHDLPNWRAFADKFLDMNAVVVDQLDERYDEAVLQNAQYNEDVRAHLERWANPSNDKKIRTNSLAWIPPDAAFQVIDFGTQSTIMPTISEIVQSSARAYNGTAKEGAFVRMRPCAIDPQSIKSNNLYHAGSSGYYQCWFHALLPSGVYYNAFVEPVAPGATVAIASLTPLLDTLWDENFNFAWVVFTGMQPNLTSTTGVGGNLLRKMIVGFEVQPTMKSPYAATVKSSPPPDFPAMEALTRALYDLPDGEPARNNFFGALVKGATKVARVAVPIAADYMNSRRQRTVPQPIPPPRNVATTAQVSNTQREIANLSARVEQLVRLTEQRPPTPSQARSLMAARQTQPFRPLAPAAPRRRRGFNVRRVIPTLPTRRTRRAQRQPGV